VIRELHAHQERQHESIRSRHREIVDEFEHVKAELDALSTELHMLTEHGVALDANFSKFGYSAHLSMLPYCFESQKSGVLIMLQGRKISTRRTAH